VPPDAIFSGDIPRDVEDRRVNSLVKRVLATARARGAPGAGACIVCHSPVARAEPSLRMHAGIVHTRCARYRQRAR
jgi:hypothetical protein